MSICVTFSFTWLLDVSPGPPAPNIPAFSPFKILGTCAKNSNFENELVYKN